jgi:hypothetical protein
MNKKLPKLELWKKTGARSVLVLENRDLALSNRGVILEAAEYGPIGRMKSGSWIPRLKKNGRSGALSEMAFRFPTRIRPFDTDTSTPMT